MKNRALNNTIVSGFFTGVLISFSSIAASADPISIQSLKRDGAVRDLCIAKRNNGIRYKRCNGKSSQLFEIEGDKPFKVSRKGKCIVAEFRDDLDKVRKNITKNVKIRMGDCTPRLLNPNKDQLKDLVVAFWTLDRGNRIRLKDNIGALDICLSDGDRNDKIKAVDCSNNANPGRWRIN